MNNNLKVGLVLSAGGAKGLTYIGVIKVLEKHNVPIHCITGASAGALIGGVYASGTSIEKIEEVALSVGYRDLAKLIDPIKPSIALIKGNKIIKFLSENLFQERIEDFKIPFACVATDIFTGKKVVFNKLFKTWLEEGKWNGITLPGGEKLVLKTSVLEITSTCGHHVLLLKNNGESASLPVTVLYILCSIIEIKYNSTMKQSANKEKRERLLFYVKTIYHLDNAQNGRNVTHRSADGDVGI